MTDNDTHVERINPGNITGPETVIPGVVPRRLGNKRPYRLLAKGTHDGRLVNPGEIVWLYEHEAGRHHILVETRPSQTEQKVPEDETRPIRRKEKKEEC